MVQGTEIEFDSPLLHSYAVEGAMIISMSRSGLLKSCPKFIIERSEIRKKQHDFKSVHFERKMVLFYMIWEHTLSPNFFRGGIGPK